MAKTLLKIFEGIDIFVDGESGKFSATIDRKTISKSSLRDVEKEIEKTKGALPAYELNRYMREPRKVEILGFEKGRARLKEGGRLASYSDRFFIIDEASLEKLEDIRKKLEELSDLWDEEVNSLQQVTERDFSELRKARSGSQS